MTTDHPPVNLATIDLSFHHAAAGLVRAVLKRHGIEVQEIRAPHEAAFELLKNGAADILCAAWLPGSHGGYFSQVADDFEKIAVLYTPYALWGVPDYVPADVVSHVADLTRTDVVGKMTKLIQGIGPGAGISRFSREIFDAYQLETFGYHFENGTLEDCINAFERAVAERRWVVVPLWQPQYLHHEHAIRELVESRGLLRGTDQATLIVRKSLLSSLPQSAIDALRDLAQGNAEVTRLDYLISREKLTPLQAANQYLNQDI